MSPKNWNWDAGFSPKASRLLVGRALWIRGMPMYVGVPSPDPSSAPSLVERTTGLEISRDLLRSEVHSEVVAEVGEILAEHRALNRALEHRREEFREWAALRRLRLGDIDARTLSRAQERFASLDAKGLFRTPLYAFLRDGACVAISPLTGHNRAHNDLLSFTTFRLQEALKAGGVRASLERGKRGWLELAESCVRRVIEKSVDPESLQKRVGAFKDVLSVERHRERPLFALDAEHILDAPVPLTADLLDPLAVLSPIRRAIPGMNCAPVRETRPGLSSVVPVEAAPQSEKTGFTPRAELGLQRAVWVPAQLLPWIDVHAVTQLRPRKTRMRKQALL
jgi:hypothetical protein